MNHQKENQEPLDLKESVVALEKAAEHHILSNNELSKKALGFIGYLNLKE